MTTWLLLLVLVAVPVWLAGAAPSYQAATVIAVNLEANTASQALAIDDATPRLGWQLSSSATNVMQTSYQILVATSANLNKSAAIWNSGTVSNSNPYAG